MNKPAHIHNPGDVVISRITANITHPMPEQGMNSQTYLVHDPQLNTDMVLKEVSYQDAGTAAKVLAEAQRLQMVEHPHVARVQYASDDGSGTIRVAMPFYRQGSLSQKLEQGPLRIRDSLRYTQHVLQALAHVHAQDLIHADVKPSNVLIDDRDMAILTDFGQSVAVRSVDQLAPRPSMYTLAFPPEAVTSAFINRQADIFQAGLMLYRLLNGPKIWLEQVASADRYSQAQQLGQAMEKANWPRRELWLPHIPDNLRSVIRKAMNPDLQRRYTTVDEFTNALGQLQLPERLALCEIHETPDGWEWKHHNGLQEYTTVLRQDQKGAWDVASTRTNTVTSDTENLRKHSHRGLPKRALAFGHIHTRFGNL